MKDAAEETKLKKLAGKWWDQLPACPECTQKHGMVRSFEPLTNSRSWFCRACWAKGES